MADLNVQQRNIINELKQAHPELASYSDEQILTIYNESYSNVQLSEDERVSILTDNSLESSNIGLNLEKTPTELTSEQINELKKNLKSRINEVSNKTAEVEKTNGFIGKAWNWTKNNLLDWCTDSTNDIKKAQEADLKALESDDIQTAFKQITGLDYNVDNVNKFLNNEIKTSSEQALEGYKEGQEMVTDITGDIVSGIFAVGIYAGIAASGGILLGLGIAAASAGLIKTGIKFGDANSADREYSSKNFLKDMITGGFSGLIAPITGGLGGAVGKTVATKFGIQATKTVGKEVYQEIVEQTMKDGLKQGFKTALKNPTGYKYTGGSMLARGTAISAEMAADGAMGGAIDTTFREGYDEIEKDGTLDSSKLGSSFVQGLLGGLFMAPVVGGGMKLSGNIGHSIGNNLPSFHLPNIKAKLDVHKFNSNFSTSKFKKHWKSIQELEQAIYKDVPEVKTEGLDAFKAQTRELQNLISEKYPSNIDYFRRKELLDRIPTEYSYLGYTVPTSEQYVLIKALENRGVKLADAYQRAMRCKTPTQCYIVEQMLSNPQTARDLGIFWSNINEIQNIEQATLVLDILRKGNSENAKIYHLKNIKTPEQVYLYSKFLNIDDLHHYVELIEKVNSPEGLNIASALVSANKEKEALSISTIESIIEYSQKEPKVIPLLLKIANNPKLKTDKKFLEAIDDYQFGRTPYALEVLNYVMSHKKLCENEEFISKHLSTMMYAKTPEEVQTNLYALDYILSNKNLSNSAERISDLVGAFKYSNKEAIDAKIKIIEYLTSRTELSQNKNLIFSSYLEGCSDCMKSADKAITKYAEFFNSGISSNLFEYAPALAFNKINNTLKVVSAIVADKNFQKYKKLGDGTDLKIIDSFQKYFPNNLDKAQTEEYINMAKILLSKESCAEYIGEILGTINGTNKKSILGLIQNHQKYNIPENRIVDLIALIRNNIDFKDDYQRALKRYGYDKIKNFSDEEFACALLFNSLYKKTNINEIPIYEKRKLLRNIVFVNTGLFNMKSDLLKDYPLLPQKPDEYCALLPALVRSIGIETNKVSSERIGRFNQSLTSLSKTLGDIKDKDFANLKISQKYHKDAFITDVLKIVQDLPATERQKVYDYFGFELHHNDRSATGFAISGYPVNLNNGKKLAQISDPDTKAVVEKLRPYVVKFSERNPIKCDNPQVEQLLNEIVDILPEIRVAIGKKQHKTQGYDIMQHSLKVLQKISQDSGFKKLNESDKRIMILAALMHDLSKGEGYTDNLHAMNGSFDAYYISKKLRLTDDESTKLYSLIRHHEWLEYVNTARNSNGEIDMAMLTERLKSVAFDLQADNLFDMSLMFTHADLRAVKLDDSFHDLKVGAKGRTDAAGNSRSYGDLADDYAKIMRKFITELKASQPLLPHTTTPRASKVARAITRVNADGSTNLKGIYVDSKDNLIIVKFNEATDKTWEAIGMPKGSSSQTGRVNIKAGTKTRETVDVGNINFIVHALDYENQLINFDSFGLKSSNSLLSVSYTERPRDKYRFFRTQGLTLKVKTKYIHGGGKTDAGSGYQKTIEGFKQNYVFGGDNEMNRVFFSDLVKEATGMSDKQYIEFVERNANKPMSEIEPADVRDKIIKIYAEINSAHRKRGNRSYNECYASNVEAAAPFAYPDKGSVGNPVDFLNSEDVAKRTAFLRKYALQNDEVFIVFGD